MKDAANALPCQRVRLAEVTTALRSEIAQPASFPRAERQRESRSTRSRAAGPPIASAQGLGFGDDGWVEVIPARASPVGRGHMHMPELRLVGLAATNAATLRSLYATPAHVDVFCPSFCS